MASDVPGTSKEHKLVLKPLSLWSKPTLYLDVLVALPAAPWRLCKQGQERKVGRRGGTHATSPQPWLSILAARVGFTSYFSQLLINSLNSPQCWPGALGGGGGGVPPAAFPLYPSSAARVPCIFQSSRNWSASSFY